ncbi:type II secretion system protein [Paenibacillus sp. 19GGS1-52]|uniref:type II secretion system protein n=1 Tax=Paenibacillus sp. 19GGS1-52 TaxID=2758563 RepID=UPI001EFB3B0B|nr:type II secretion system protein [Paenibacillus sp. 19GGS1-52]ULO07980.1 type II secretion system protein [Paenibacillus sp. 19GGS1-52]
MLAEAVKRRLGKEENQKGFTLIELLAVIVILGIIAVIAIPLIGNVISNAKEDSDVATARQIYDASRLYIVGESNGKFNSTTPVTVTIAQMQDKGYLDSPLSLPSSKVTISAGTVYYTAEGQLDYIVISPKPEGSSAVTGDTTSGKFSAEQVLKSKAK